MNKRINSSWFLDPVDESSIDNTAAENVSVRLDIGGTYQT